MSEYELNFYVKKDKQNDNKLNILAARGIKFRFKFFETQQYIIGIRKTDTDPYCKMKKFFCFSLCSNKLFFL